jgi:hypothetical protein
MQPCFSRKRFPIKGEDRFVRYSLLASFAVNEIPWAWFRTFVQRDLNEAGGSFPESLFKRLLQISRFFGPTA